MNNNVFLKPSEFYQRNVNPLKQYVDQSSFYLSKMTGKDISYCRTYLINKIKNKEFKGSRDPVVKFYHRGDNGDRYQDEIRLSKYISSVVQNEEIMAPTLTTYVNPKYKKSLIVGFTDNNVILRAKSKKEAFKAEAEKNELLFTFKNNEQQNMKAFNNSMSGAFVAKGYIFNNPTAHSTLTTITRTEASLGNASNEKILAGNRHYHCPEVTLDNIISITSSINREQMKSIIEKYNLKYPTYEDVIDCVKYSSDLYWKDTNRFKNIENFVRNLDEIERAGFVYIGDLYHIRQHNPEFIRSFLGSLSKRVTGKEYQDPVSVINKIDPQVVNVAHQICNQETKGKGKDYSKFEKVELDILAATCENIVTIVEMYKDFIDAIFLTINLPASSAYIPYMVRRTVVLSDTDSTMFSVDEYVNWYFGDIIFTPEALGLAASVMFIATQCIAHTLAIFSANMNVEREKLHSLEMKPEFSFPVFAKAPVAKHYYTCMSVKEGNVYDKVKMEIKGVNLKNSALPPKIIKQAQDRMEYILKKIMNNEKISITEELTRLANLEQDIKNSLLSGDVDYFKHTKVKDASAYARDADSSPYINHTFWVDVFQPKYGAIVPPPYTVINIPTILTNPTQLKEYLNSIEDTNLRDRFGIWLAKYKKRVLKTIYISYDYVRAYGIPEELKPIIDYKDVVLKTTGADRMILQTLGYYPKDKILISEVGY